jgi:hypothetical protein
MSHARLDSSPFESGGDDGARTRDLCRDSYAHGRNLLISGALVAAKSIQNHPKTEFRTVVRTVNLSAQTFAVPGQKLGRGLQT